MARRELRARASLLGAPLEDGVLPRAGDAHDDEHVLLVGGGPPGLDGRAGARRHRRVRRPRRAAQPVERVVARAARHAVAHAAAGARRRRRRARRRQHPVDDGGVHLRALGVEARGVAREAVRAAHLGLDAAQHDRVLRGVRVGPVAQVVERAERAAHQLALEGGEGHLGLLHLGERRQLVLRQRRQPRRRARRQELLEEGAAASCRGWLRRRRARHPLRSGSIALQLLRDLGERVRVEELGEREVGVLLVDRHPHGRARRIVEGRYLWSGCRLPRRRATKTNDTHAAGSLREGKEARHARDADHAEAERRRPRFRCLSHQPDRTAAMN